jgi:hypothetical protein
LEYFAAKMIRRFATALPGEREVEVGLGGAGADYPGCRLNGITEEAPIV